MTDTSSFSCTACGAPNTADAEAARMACAYCGANLIIPRHLQTKAVPRMEKIPSKAESVISLKVDAPDLLEKIQPAAIKVWNTYAYWTWIRWLFPTCLTILVVVCFLCAALGMLPSVFRLFR